MGQVTWLLQPPLALQSIVQLCVPVLHDVHWLGHTGASIGLLSIAASSFAFGSTTQ